jgi:phage host-nuclease inhibitor protein Gam
MIDNEALKEENENLKQQLEIDKNQINYFIEENEKQKKQIKQLEDFIKSAGEIDHINHEYTYKLKKVLQEVKSIAKGVRSYLGVPAPRDVRFEMDRILNLIIKVEEE